MRCLYVHQQLLSVPAASLHEALLGCMERVAALASSASASSSAPSSASASTDLPGRLHLEMGMVHNYYSEYLLAKDSFERARTWAGLQLELTGALGLRTKFQQKAVAQLRLEVQSSRTAAAAAAASSSTAASASSPTATEKDHEEGPTPKSVPLNDDTLLEAVRYEDGAAGGSELLTCEQCIVLAMCLNVRNSNPRHGLTTEEMHPYVEAALRHPRAWAVQTMALLTRSRLELESSRKFDRAIVQMQGIVDDIDGAADAPSAVTERQRYMFSVAFPPFWELKKELGKLYLSAGLPRDAKVLFEALEMWNEIISCYQMLEMVRIVINPSSTQCQPPLTRLQPPPPPQTPTN